MTISYHFEAALYEQLTIRGHQATASRLRSVNTAWLDRQFFFHSLAAPIWLPTASPVTRFARSTDKLPVGCDLRSMDMAWLDGQFFSHSPMAELPIGNDFVLFFHTVYTSKLDLPSSCFLFPLNSKSSCRLQRLRALGITRTTTATIS